MNKSLSLTIHFCLWGLLVLMFLPALSFCQLPNAFDYFPLAVGNEWIYWELQLDPYFNRIVSSDTLLGDSLRIYQVLEEETLLYYHYNEDSTIVYQSSEFPQDSNSGFPVINTQNGLDKKWVTSQDGNTRAFALVDTGTLELFNQTWQDVHLYEVDPFADSLTLLESLGRYAMGIGLVGAGESGLLYAQIDGIEYGERPTSVENKTEEHNPIIPANFKLLVYPNPVKEKATFLIFTQLRQDSEIQVVDILGRTISKIVMNPLTSPFEFVWDGRDLNGNTLANGVYFVSLRSGQLITSKGFIFLK